MSWEKIRKYVVLGENSFGSSFYRMEVMFSNNNNEILSRIGIF